MDDTATSKSLSSSCARWLRGSLFCGFWLGSICSGFLFLYCPLLPLLLFNQKLFRKITDLIFAAWEMYPVAMMECFLGMRVLVTGDKILPQDRSILVMNHRTRLDWNFLWAAMFHACQPLAHRLKFVLKNPIRHVPGPGWVMQMNCFLYIHRRWERDKELLARTLDYLADIDYTYQVLLFPEGTDLTPKSRQRSHQFAESHHLERYQQVLHPKTTGFVFLAQRMRQNGSLDAVYDLSIGYPCNLPQSELELIKGNFPREVHFHITRYPTSSLPTEDAKLRDWLAALWRRKEATLTSFYETGSFAYKPCPPSESLLCPPLPARRNLSQPDLALSVATPDPTSQIPSPDYSDLKTPTDTAKHPDTLPVFKSRPFDQNEFRSDGSRLSDIDSTCQAFHSHALHLAFMFWTCLCLFALYTILTSTFVQCYAVVNCALFFVLSTVTQGVNHVEISLHEMKKKCFPCYQGSRKLD